MKRNFILLFVIICGLNANAQIYFNRQAMQEKRKLVQRGAFADAYRKLIADADKLLSVRALSVMDKKHVSRSGDKHDYFSLNYYTWPDTSKADGRPYIAVDCKVNPAYKEYDYDNLDVTTNRIQILTLAWFYSRDERYAAKAVELIKTWFLNEETRMNPNLNFCQVWPGKNDDFGCSVLEGSKIATIVNSASILASSRSFHKSDQKLLKSWVDDIHQNIVTNKGGQWCNGLENNIAVAYDHQRVVYWLYCGHKKQARAYLKTFPERRLAKQIAPDGSQPLELKRPNAFHYSWYNLQWLTSVYIIASINGVDIANRILPNGASYYSALDFLLPYIDKEREAWPYSESTKWHTVQTVAHRELYRVGQMLNVRYKPYGSVPESSIYRLMY